MTRPPGLGAGPSGVESARTRGGDQESSGPLLRLEGLTVNYGPVTAVSDLSLSLERGEILTILGANGAGKTTTLKALVSLLPVTTGQVVFDGEAITRLPTEAIVRRGMTLVPEGRHVFGRLTVLENLRLGGAAWRGPRYERPLKEVLEMFPVLTERLGVQAGLLSGGEQQMLAIARALMSRPRMLLLDEPSLGLAPRVAALVFELIGELRRRGMTVLLVEQNVERALELADRAYVLSAGKVELSGDTESLVPEEIESAYLGISARST